MISKGDAFPVVLDYTLDGVPIEDADLDEIEFSVGSRSLTLTGGDIELDPTEGKYVVFISQAVTLKLGKIMRYKARFKKGTAVASTKIETMKIGASLSSKIL